MVIHTGAVHITPSGGEGTKILGMDETAIGTSIKKGVGTELCSKGGTSRNCDSSWGGFTTVKRGVDEGEGIHSSRDGLVGGNAKGITRWGLRA
jgi:hypothetical protein